MQYTAFSQVTGVYLSDLAQRNLAEHPEEKSAEISLGLRGQYTWVSELRCTGGFVEVFIRRPRLCRMGCKSDVLITTMWGNAADRSQYGFHQRNTDELNESCGGGFLR